MPVEKWRHKSHGGGGFLHKSFHCKNTEKWGKCDHQKERQKKKGNALACVMSLDGRVMRVTWLTSPVLLPGTGSEVSLLNPSVWKLPTQKRSSDGAES